MAEPKNTPVGTEWTVVDAPGATARIRPQHVSAKIGDVLIIRDAHASDADVEGDDGHSYVTLLDGSTLGCGGAMARYAASELTAARTTSKNDKLAIRLRVVRLGKRRTAFQSPNVPIPA